MPARISRGGAAASTDRSKKAQEGGRSYDVVISGSIGVNPGYVLVGNKDYPQIVDDYVRSFKTMRALPVDVFLGAHGAFYGLTEKYPQLGKGGPNPFLDPAGFKSYVDRSEKSFLTTLEEQKKSNGEGGATAAENTQKAKEAASAYAKKYLGLSKSERRWYAELGVDPYTDNEALKKAVKEVSRVEAAASFGMRFAGLPGIPGAREIGKVVLDLARREGAGVEQLVRIGPCADREEGVQPVQHAVAGIGFTWSITVAE